MEQQGSWSSSKAKLASPSPRIRRSAGMMVIVVVIVVLVVMIDLLKGLWADQAIDSSTYQIVTLDVGRSYFGSLKGLGKEYALLKNAFYLQAETPPTTEEESTEEGEQKVVEDELPFSLQRVGNQLYQGTDDLSIKTEHIVSWQNLEEDSPVVKAINDYLESQEEASGDNE